ncbi:MAG: hypothetical protein ACFHX7_22975 [Pseudomonadota bacterium]
MIRRMFCITLIWAAAAVNAEPLLSEPEVVYRERQGLLALDRYLETWNTRSPERWITAMHFPHIRPGAGDFGISRTADDYLRGVDFDRTLASGWRYTRWDDQRVIHVAPRKVHVSGWWHRFLEDGSTQMKGQMTYIVTEIDGIWRIQLRFAAGPPNVDGVEAKESRQGALAAVSGYFEAVNSHDAATLANAVHYPHVRHGDDQAEWWMAEDEFLAGPEPGRARTWQRTRLLDAEVIQISRNGANVSVRFSREATTGKGLGEYDAVMLATRRDGVWKIQALSTTGL